MLRKASVLALALTMSFASAARAQGVDDIVKKANDARGGVDKMKAVKSVKMTGTMSLQGLEAPATMVQRRPDAVRMDITVQGKSIVQAYDGTAGWSINPFAGGTAAEAMSEDDRKEFADDADIDGPLVDWKAKGNTVELLGKDELEGSPVYKVKVTRKSGSIVTVFLDADSYLPVKESSKRTVRGQEITADSFPSNYKPINGVMYPFSLEQKINGTTAWTFTVTNVEVNGTVDDATFKMPAKPAAAAAPAAKP